MLWIPPVEEAACGNSLGVGALTLTSTIPEVPAGAVVIRLAGFTEKLLAAVVPSAPLVGSAKFAGASALSGVK
jgi:hypothetical protein